MDRMGQSLSALLVHDRKLAFRQVDAAVQRQRREGGALDTCLLELGQVELAVVHEYLSKVSGLPALDDAVAARLERPATSMVSAEEALREGIVPLCLMPGQLQCAVMDAPGPALVASIAREHGIQVVPLVTPEFRWNALYAAAYGVPLGPRFEALNRRFPAAIGFASGSSDRESPMTSSSFQSLPTDDGAFGSRNWSLDELTEYFSRSVSRDDVLRAALGFVGNVIARRMVVIPAGDHVRVFDSAGYGEAHARLAGQTAVIPLGSMFERVVGESTYYFGPSAPAGVGAVFALGGLDVPHDVALVPVRVGSRTALVLLGDNVDAPIDPRLIPLLFVVVGRLGQALEAMIRRRKEERNSSDHEHVAPAATREARAAAQELNARVISKLLAIGEPVAAGAGALPDDGWDLPVTFTSARVLAAPSAPSPQITLTLPVGSAASPNTTQIIESAANAARDMVALSQPTPHEPLLLSIELEPVEPDFVATTGASADSVTAPRSSVRPLASPSAASASAQPPTGPDHTTLSPAALIELLSSTTPGVPESAQRELLVRGKQAHAALLDAFPGPILPGGTGATALEIPVEQQGLLLHIVALQADDLHAHLEILATQGTSLQRFYALATLARAQHPSAAHLAAQQVLDTDDALRTLCLRIVDHGRDSAARTHAERLALTALASSAERTVEHAINACHVLRLASSVPRMIDLLDNPSARVADRAHSALVRLTLRDAGRTTRRWKPWLVQHTTLDRNLWLLEAMVDTDRKVRENAHRELRQMTLSGINYTPDLDPRALQAAQRAVARKLGVTSAS
jgi:hypothetical protein